MIFYGKIKNVNEYGFGVFEDKFDTYVEIDEELHMQLIEKANNENKEIIPDENGFPKLVDRKPPSEKEMAEYHIQELQFYLKETDWYVLRFIETNKPIPTDIKIKRQNAREKISELRKLL